MTVSTRLPKAATAPAAARRVIDGLDSWLYPEAAVNARLLVSEVVTNAVRHVEEDGEIGVQVALHGQALYVEVLDPGAGFDGNPRTPDSRRGGGWGLQLVDRLSDRWGVESGGPTRVWFQIDGAVAA